MFQDLDSLQFDTKILQCSCHKLMFKKRLCHFVCKRTKMHKQHFVLEMVKLLLKTLIHIILENHKFLSTFETDVLFPTLRKMARKVSWKEI